MKRIIVFTALICLFDSFSLFAENKTEIIESYGSLSGDVNYFDLEATRDVNETWSVGGNIGYGLMESKSIELSKKTIKLKHTEKDWGFGAHVLHRKTAVARIGLGVDFIAWDALQDGKGGINEGDRIASGLKISVDYKIGYNFGKITPFMGIAYYFSSIKATDNALKELGFHNDTTFDSVSIKESSFFLPLELKIEVDNFIGILGVELPIFIKRTEDKYSIDGSTSDSLIFILSDMKDKYNLRLGIGYRF